MDYLATVANEASEYNVSRRKMLALTSGGVAMALAGCTGGGESSNGEGADTFVGVITGHSTSESDIQFSPHNVTIDAGTRTQSSVFPYLAVPSRETNEWIPVAAKEWSVEGTTFSITLLDGFTWTNGDAVTADDVARALKLNAYMGSEVSTYVENPSDITTTDEKTVEIALSSEFNEDGIFSNVFQNVRISAPEGEFGEFETRFDEASSDKEIEQIQTELGKKKWTEPELTCGPFKFESITDQSITFKRFEDYPLEEIQQNIKEQTDYDLTEEYGPDPGYSTLKLQFATDKSKTNQMAINGEMDGGDGLDIDSDEVLKENYPDSAEYRPVPGAYGTAIMFNVIDSEHADAWREENVRKAVAHIIDVEAISKQLYGNYTDIRRRFSGLTPLLEKQYLDEEFLSSLTTYEQDEKKAESLLTEADFERNDGNWVKPNGEKLKATFESPAGLSMYEDGFTVAAENLKKFGIEAETNAIENSTFFGKTQENLEWNLTRAYYSGPNPPLAFKRSWIRYDGPEEYDYSAFLQEPHDSSVVTVPEIGNADSEGTVDINIVESYEALTKTSDEKKITELMKKLSWAYNQTVPRIPMGQVQYPYYMTSDDWKYPPADHALGRIYPLTWGLPQIGAIKAKE